MTTTKVSLPDAMKTWVDNFARIGQYSKAGDHVGYLMRREEELLAKLAQIQRLMNKALSAGEGQRSMQATEAEALARPAKLK